MDIERLKNTLKSAEENIAGNLGNLPRPARIAIASIVGIFIIWAVFSIARYVWNRALEERLNMELNAIRLDQKIELDALRLQAVKIGNVPKDSITEQKKKLDTANKSLKGPQTSLLQQSAELNALRVSASQ